MKPDCLMLTIYDEEGLKTIRSYPQILSKRDTKKLMTVGLPYGASEGSFLRGEIGKYTYASYIFFIPGEISHYTSAFIAVFKKNNPQADNIDEILKSLVNKAREYNFTKIEDYANNLPDFHKELITGGFTFKATTTVTLSIDTNKKKEKIPRKDAIESFGKDIWDEESWKEDEDHQDESPQEETEIKVQAIDDDE